LVKALKYLWTKSKILGNLGNKEDPDGDISIEEKCKKYGYQFYEHEITTEDGYILKLHQIYKGSMFVQSWAPVVLMQHGINSKSDTWF